MSPGRMNNGRMLASGFAEHFLSISNSASRFDSMYLEGTTGRNASAAEMYTNERDGLGTEGVGEPFSIVLRTVRAAMINQLGRLLVVAS